MNLANLPGGDEEEVDDEVEVGLEDRYFLRQIIYVTCTALLFRLFKKIFVETVMEMQQ